METKKINLKKRVAKKSQRICIAIQPELHKAIKKQADLNELSVNETIIQLIKIALQQQ